MQWVSLFNKRFWENGAATCKRMKLDHFLTPYTKINSKWIQDLNVKPETIKILEESAGVNFSDISDSTVFLDVSPQARETKTKIKQLGPHQNKNCTVKGTVNKTKRQPPQWEKIFANDVSDKGLASKIYEEVI